MLETFKSPEKLPKLKDKNSPVETSSPDKRKVFRLAPLKNRMRGSLVHEEIEPTIPISPNQATHAKTNENINRLIENMNESFGSRYDEDDEEMQNIMQEVDDIITLCTQPKSPVVIKKVKVMKNSPIRQQVNRKKRSNSEHKRKNINWIFTLPHTASKEFRSSHTSRIDLKHRKSSQEQLTDSYRKLDLHHRNISRQSIPLNESKATRRTSRDSRMTHTHDDSPEDLRHSRSHARFGSKSSISFHPDPLLYFNNDLVFSIQFYRTPPKPLLNSISSKDLPASSEKAVLNKIDSIIKMMRSTTRL